MILSIHYELKTTLSFSLQAKTIAKMELISQEKIGLYWQFSVFNNSLTPFQTHLSKIQAI